MLAIRVIPVDRTLVEIASWSQFILGLVKYQEVMDRRESPCPAYFDDVIIDSHARDDGFDGIIIDVHGEFHE